MGTLSFKENMKKYYDQEAALRDGRSVKADWKIKVRKRFYDFAERENKKTLLELGAGAGYDSLFFMENGLHVTAVDLSGEMVRKCREKNIDAHELDFYILSSLNRKFDCIYAINTLLHVPKTDLGHVLSEIDAVLEEDGLFYMGVYGGEDTENDFVKSEVSNAPRFFSFYSAQRLEAVLNGFFDILEFESFDIGTGTDIFHSIILRKKAYR